MRQLKMKSKPKFLTLQEVYELYRLDTGTETSEFIIKVLDLCYPKLNREGISGIELILLSRKATESNNYTEIKSILGGW